ncbi:MAG: aldehyde dehydrogenase family protein [Trueperaceae bacterium]
MLIAGRWEQAVKVIEVRNPQDGTLVDTVPMANAGQMRHAIDCAVEGGRHWRKAPTHERMRVLSEAAATIARESEAFARTIALEGIKTIREARAEVARCVETLRISAEEARRLDGETIRFDQVPGSERRKGFWTREPIGIVGAITPFNDPLNLVAHKVGPALAAGNAVIVKPDSRTPLSALKLAAALHEAGVPTGVLQVVTGPGSSVGVELVRDPRVRLISFTGGRETGERIMRDGGFKKYAMELGNNAPVIVLGDADLAEAAESIVSGAFWAAGQNCLHAQRILVHESVFDRLIPKLVAGAEHLRMGDKLDETTDMGPMIDEAAAARVEEMVEDALSQGARCLTGGRREGSFFQPTLLDRVSPTARLYREEVYGPVSLVQPFAVLNEAIEQANAVEFGLQAAIFTQDLDTAFQVSDELDYGGVIVNDSSDYRIDAMPFGGPKGSGLGREGVRFAMEEMSEPKLLSFRLKGVRVDSSSDRSEHLDPRREPQRGSDERGPGAG